MSEDYDYYGDDYDDTIEDEDEDTLTDPNKIKDSTKEHVNFYLDSALFDLDLLSQTHTCIQSYINISHEFCFSCTYVHLFLQTNGVLNSLAHTV